MTENETLVSLIEAVYEGRGIPMSVADELARGHEHPENRSLYEQLVGLEWRDVTAEMIERTYPIFFLLSDPLMAYFLPATLKHIVIRRDLGTVEELLRRIVPHWKTASDFDALHVCRVYGLNTTRVCLLKEVLQWVLRSVSELEWKDVCRLEIAVTELSKLAT